MKWWFKRAPDFKVPGYLHRWYTFRRNYYFNIYWHQMIGNDPSHVHDHPWLSVSIILSGSYREHFHDGTHKDRKPGRIIFRSPRSLHRLEMLTKEVHTVLVRGPAVRRWGFLTPTGWEYHKTYNEKNTTRESLSYGLSN